MEKKINRHDDANSQYQYINDKATIFIKNAQPVISIDIEKMPKDFSVKALEKVVPYGIIDKNTGFIDLGTCEDNSKFVVESILRWWQILGKNTYPDAKEILIIGSDEERNVTGERLWKKQLQDLASITKLKIYVTHFPPLGMFKWNKIEHKMFCLINRNWKNKTFCIETVISLVSNTGANGITIKYIDDKSTYKLSRKVTDEEFEKIKIEYEEFHGKWNYCVSPSE
ncbi:hypothetical protein FACS189465_3190 [Clostridia bacterium]|nr:hypothetical protein FACS189465_3190 [Clostridia bacterium]